MFILALRIINNNTYNNYVLSFCYLHIMMIEFQVHAEVDFKFNKNKQISAQRKEFCVQYPC